VDINYLTPSSYNWYKVTIQDLGTTLKFDIYNATLNNNTLLYEAIVADVVMDWDGISIHTSYLGGYGYQNFGVDNVVASVVSPASVSNVSWFSRSYVVGDNGKFVRLLR